MKFNKHNSSDFLLCNFGALFACVEEFLDSFARAPKKVKVATGESESKAHTYYTNHPENGEEERRRERER